jgi:phosphatidylglycerol:prolipoprotein diacylglycerol transferase
MLCISLVLGWFLTLGLAERDGLPRETMANCYVVTALAALVGARLLYVLTNWQEFSSLSDILALRRGGLVAYGGFLGGFAGSFLFLRRAGLRLLPWADVAVPSLATGLIFTRLGCYLFGCDFGRPLSEAAPRWLASLGTFPRWDDVAGFEASGSPAWVQHVAERGLPTSAASSLPVHPTQLYESLVGVALVVLLFSVRRYQRFRGQVFLAFTFAYGILRFALEVVRDDAERGSFGPMLAEHWLVASGLAIFALAFGLGPGASITDQKLRIVSRVFAGLLPVAALAALRPGTSEVEGLGRLSTSQWIALFTAVASAIAWARLSKAASADPARAMSLDMSDKDDAPPSDETPARATNRRRKPKITVRATPVAKRQTPPPEEAEESTEDGTKPEPV